MRTSLKLGVAALAATVLLSAAVGSASARNLSINNQNLRITFSSLELSAPEVATIRCKVTVEGSFHTRTITKVAGSLAGAITRSVVKQETCTNGSVASFNGVERYNGTTSPNSLPWHLTYESFTGTLPNITSLQVLFSRFRFGVTVSGICAGQYGTAEDNVTLAAAREAAGGITGATLVAGRNEATLFRRDTGISCPLSGAGGGSGTPMQLGATTRLTITLI